MSEMVLSGSNDVNASNKGIVVELEREDGPEELLLPRAVAVRDHNIHELADLGGFCTRRVRSCRQDGFTHFIQQRHIRSA